MLALNDSTDISDTIQSLIIICGVDINFNITEELPLLESMHDRTTEANIFIKGNHSSKTFTLLGKSKLFNNRNGSKFERGQYWLYR